MLCSDIILKLPLGFPRLSHLYRGNDHFERRRTPNTTRLANQWRKLGRHLPSRSPSRLSCLIPRTQFLLYHFSPPLTHPADRPQPLVDDILVLNPLLLRYTASSRTQLSRTFLFSLVMWTLMPYACPLKFLHLDPHVIINKYTLDSFPSSHSRPSYAISLSPLSSSRSSLHFFFLLFPYTLQYLFLSDYPPKPFTLPHLRVLFHHSFVYLPLRCYNTE